jgi:helicase
MRIDILEAYNLDRDILDIWRRTVGPELLPVQERAVKEFGLFGRDNLIVFSPTSSGKTFVGEMAAVKAAREKTKVFYLVPQKALAEEKFRDFSARYAEAQIRVVISSRDHREHDSRIIGRDFQIAVVVFEKLQSLLVSHPSLAQAVGLVVVDELQMLTDEERGPGLELLLTKLKMATSRPRIVGLSAVLGRAELLADWLDAKLLIENRRPVELRKGVLCNGVFRYREHNSTGEGSEEIMVAPSKDREELLVGAADTLARAGEPVLMFVPDRATAVGLARRLSARVSLPAARTVMDRLREGEETHARAELMETLESGIAFHHADLTADERGAVEEGFRSGEIRALVSTSTLAVGMNLPAKNVLLDGRRWRLLKEYRRWSLEDLSKSEYENMSGRAGRLALTNDFGRSILVTESKFEADVWLRHYAGGDFETVTPTLKDAPLEDHVLDLIASGLAQSRAQAGDLLLASFTGRVHWREKMSPEDFRTGVDRAVELCRAGGLAQARANGSLQITKLGLAVAGRGIGVATAVALAEWAIEARRATVGELEVLTLLGLTPAGSQIYVTLGRQEDRQRDYRDEIVERARAAGVDGRPLFQKFVEDRWAAEYDEARACKKAGILADWINEEPTKEIEERFQVWAGAIRRIGEEYGWLCQALADLCRASRWSAPPTRWLMETADRIVFGVQPDAIPLMRLRVPRLGRALVRRLREAGVLDPGEMTKAGPDVVRRALGRQSVFEALWSKLENPSTARPDDTARRHRLASRAADAPLETPPPDASAGEPVSGPTLLVDLPGRLVRYRGVAIPTKPPNHLKRQALFALAYLASRPGRPVSDIELAEGMHTLGLGAKRPVAPDLRDLRYKILRPIREAMGTALTDEVDRLVVSVPGALVLAAAGAVEVVGVSTARAA